MDNKNIWVTWAKRPNWINFIHYQHRCAHAQRTGPSYTVMIFRQIKQIQVTVFKGSYFQPEPLFPSENNDPKGPLRRNFSASQPWFDHRFAVYYEMTKRAFDSWLWCRTVSLRTFSLGKILSDLTQLSRPWFIKAFLVSRKKTL